MAVRHLALTALLLAGALAGCTGAPSTAPPGCGQAAALAPARAEPEAVTFATGDGVDLRGTWHPGSGAHAAVLAHGLGGDRRGWDRLVDLLREQGWSVLTFDLRGHGESRTRGGQPYEAAGFGAEDFAAMEQDVAAALAVARGRTGTGAEQGARVCLVLGGASLGANLALRVAAAQRDHVDAAALLSPGQEYRGVRTDDVAPLVQAKPLFLAAAKEDVYAAQSAQALAGVAERETLVLVEGPAHGTGLITAGDFRGRITAWFDRLR